MNEGAVHFAEEGRLTPPRECLWGLQTGPKPDKGDAGRGTFAPRAVVLFVLSEGPSNSSTQLKAQTELEPRSPQWPVIDRRVACAFYLM